MKEVKEEAFHIKNEALSLESETVTLWCGRSFSDGSEVRFCSESQSDVATCEDCLLAFEARIVKL